MLGQLLIGIYTYIYYIIIILLYISILLYYYIYICIYTYPKSEEQWIGTQQVHIQFHSSQIGTAKTALCYREGYHSQALTMQSVTNSSNSSNNSNSMLLQ